MSLFSLCLFFQLLQGGLGYSACFELLFYSLGIASAVHCTEGGILPQLILQFIGSQRKSLLPVIKGWDIEAPLLFHTGTGRKGASRIRSRLNQDVQLVKRLCLLP